MHVDSGGGAAEFLEQACELLLEDEPRHNLALGILSFTREHPGVYPELRGWVARERGRIVGRPCERLPPTSWSHGL